MIYQTLDLRFMLWNCPWKHRIHHELFRPLKMLSDSKILNQIIANAIQPSIRSIDTFSRVLTLRNRIWKKTQHWEKYNKSPHIFHLLILYRKQFIKIYTQKPHSWCCKRKALKVSQDHSHESEIVKSLGNERRQ